MFTIYEGKLYKVDGDKIVGVDITPTSVKTDGRTQRDLPKLNTLLTLNEVKIKYGINRGNSYEFPSPSRNRKVDKDESTTKTKKPTRKSK